MNPVEPDGRSLYLDLMKRALVDELYANDPLACYTPYTPTAGTNPVAAWAYRLIARVMSFRQMRIVEPMRTPFSDTASMTPGQIADIRQRGSSWPARAHTMIGRARLDNLQMCCELALTDGVSGDFIETGVWRGGAAIFMRAILNIYGDTERRVWLADSFAGLPPPDAETYPDDRGDKYHTFSPWLACSQETVEQHFRNYGLLDDQVRFLKGWFKDTLPTAPIRQLAVLRLDGDMYESTIQALDALYAKLQPGGFVIVDDYFLPPCAKAIHDFRTAHGIADPIHDIDGFGSYWRRA